MRHCNEMMSALRSRESDAPLPGYTGHFREPPERWQCWCVVHVIQHKKLTTPRQCRLRRRGPRVKGGSPQLTCKAHASREAEAQVYRQTLYEAAKSELSCLAQTPAEYEEMVSDLAARLGV